MPVTTLAALAALAYLAGSIPFGLLFAHGRGVELRSVGSGNIGATNAARALGKKLGALVLLLDASKGALPVALGAMLVEPPHASTAAACAGMAAIIGHCYPVWLRFRGGKGVATALGTLVVIDPIILAIVVGIFALQVALLGRVSFGSLVAALCFPLLAWRLARPHELVLFALAVSALILWRHRGNLLRLSRGRENTV